MVEASQKCYLRFIVPVVAMVLSLSVSATPMAVSNLAVRCHLEPLSRADTNLVWRANGVELRFRPASRKLLFDDNIFWMNSGLTTNVGGGWAVEQVDADTVLRPLLLRGMFLSNRPVKVVVLDPGHGGKDSGAVGNNNLREKAVVLDVSKRVRRKLKAKGVTVRLTRSGDRFIDLKKRPRMAARMKADLFVSIHANKAGNSSASGIETFVMPAAGFCSTSSTKPDNRSYPGNLNNAANTILAGYIQHELLKSTGAVDRGVKRARYLVLKNAECPAALVEIGFLTNSNEVHKIVDPDYREKIADGIATGIMDYIDAASARTP